METAVFREYLAGKAFLWDTHETFCSARLYYLIHTICTHTIYTHITYKCWRVLLRENPSQAPWELEIAIPTYLYTFTCGFPQLLPLNFHIIERLIAQTFTTPFRVSSEILVLLGSIRRSQGWQMQHGACCGIWKARQDMVLSRFVGVGAWRA